MVAHTEARTIERIERVECLELLRSRTLGRVALKLTRDVLVLPVYYALVGDDVVFRTAPGTKLDAAVLRTRVAFEVDSAMPPWSVLAHGFAEELRTHADQIEACARLGEDWPAGQRERVVKIRVEAISGRRLVSA